MARVEEAAVGLGAGVYAPGEVARLAHIDSQRLRRWIHGYTYRSKGKQPRQSAPLIQRSTERTLTFLDLVEVCFVKAFLDHGVTMPTIRQVQRDAAREFNTNHPFCTRRFETDGQTIVARHIDQLGTTRLRDMKRGQYLMKEVFNPLLKQIDFDKTSEEAARWWPSGKDTPVVIDPERSFGAAVVARSNVPTRVLYGSYSAGEKPEDIADWFDVSLEEVLAAITFEKSLRLPKAS